MTAHDHAERVQGEVTAAVRRGAEAIKETVCTAWPAYVSDRMALRIARDGLAAALDVEEMAAVIDPSTIEPMRSTLMAAWREHGLDAELFMADHTARATERATALRAALLGGAA